jgi:hypothetical protein
MPPQTQRRQRAANHEDEDEEEPPRRHSRRQNDSDESEESEQDQNGDVDMGGSAAVDEDQIVKKLVRYALACEYARIPIKRDGIREKVLGNNSRSFKTVFDSAQEQLRQVFGMEMEELPVKEKRTLKEKQSMCFHNLFGRALLMNHDRGGNTKKGIPRSSIVETVHPSFDPTQSV